MVKATKCYYVFYGIENDPDEIKPMAVEIPKSIESAEDIVDAIKTEVLKKIPIEERKNKAVEINLFSINKL